MEATFVKHFSNFKQGDGIKLLRPKRKRENHRVRFLSGWELLLFFFFNLWFSAFRFYYNLCAHCVGFFCGFSIALIIAVALVLETRKLLDKEEATLYLDSIFPLYKLKKTFRFSVKMKIHLLMIFSVFSDIYIPYVLFAVSTVTLSYLCFLLLWIYTCGGAIKSTTRLLYLGSSQEPN